MKLIGTKPSPRILLWGVSPDGILASFVCRVAPTVKFLTNEAELLAIRQAEWDAVVIEGNPPNDMRLAPHLMVIQFGGIYIASYAVANPTTVVRVAPRLKSVATEFIISAGLPSPVSRLVTTTLLDFLRSQSPNWIITQASTGFAAPADVVTPFIEDADHNPLAGSINLNEREWWWLPKGAPDKDLWVAVALSEWSKIDASRFPSHPIWTERTEWQTPKEREVVSGLIALRAERDNLLTDLDLRERLLLKQFEAARSEADSADRRLLTAQGTDLVDEVKAALQELGFKVTDADREVAIKGDLLEDLRIEDPSDTGWTALAEVRGYAGGAKVSDLLRIGRFVERYVRIEKRPPSARWYIVNHDLTLDPAARPPVLAGNAADVSVFGEADGLVIDTQLLFKARDQVRNGSISPDDARRRVREARGVMAW